MNELKNGLKLIFMFCLYIPTDKPSIFALIKITILNITINEITERTINKINK